jgi:hypothetical protein
MKTMGALAAIMLMASLASAEGKTGVTSKPPGKSTPSSSGAARGFVRFVSPTTQKAPHGRAVVTQPKGKALTLTYPNGRQVTVEIGEPFRVTPGEEVLVESGGLVLEKRRTRGLTEDP